MIGQTILHYRIVEKLDGTHLAIFLADIGRIYVRSFRDGSTREFQVKGWSAIGTGPQTAKGFSLRLMRRTSRLFCMSTCRAMLLSYGKKEGTPKCQRYLPQTANASAALLSYVLGWITGLVFLLIDKRPYVRFHAAQSVAVFLGLHLLRGVLGLIFGKGWWFGGVGYWGAFTLGALLVNLFSVLSLVLWIVLMVKAFQGVRFKLPVAGEIAESLAGRTG